MRLAIRLSQPLQGAGAPTKAACGWPLRVVAALVALLLQYGCALAQPAAPFARSDLGILCERDPSRPGCERLPVQHAAASAPQGAALARRTTNPMCERDPSHPGCDSPAPQSDPRAGKVAAAVLWSLLLVLAIGTGSVGGLAFVP
jgi:hypothetical protein